MTLRLTSIGISARVARIALALLVMVGMSLPMMHVHPAHAADHATSSCAGAADPQANHSSMPAGTDHAAGLDCCLNHAPPSWLETRITLLGRLAGIPVQATVRDDLVTDGTWANRLERPPRKTV